MTAQAEENKKRSVEHEYLDEPVPDDPHDHPVGNQAESQNSPEMRLESLSGGEARSEDYLYNDINQVNNSAYVHVEEAQEKGDAESDAFKDYNMVTPASMSDRYLFCAEIGRGSQGKIIRAVRRSDYQTVVIKQLNISSIKNWKEYDLFHREAEVLSQLNISGVAKFYDAIDCLDDKPPCSYIVQEYIPGVSLRKMLDDGHRFKQENVFDILIQLLSILNQLHRHEPPVIHRDIKPSNIMITPHDNGDLSVSLIDFGAVANPKVQGGGSTMAGTFGYMPPEQLMGKPVPASDIYAVGALAVQLFCGKSPADIKMKDFRLIFEPEMPDKPHALVTTLRQMLEPKVEDRLADIDEIIQRLTNFKNGYFELTGAVDSDYSADYEQGLANLNYVGENGAVDLWQQLPEMGRKIPNAYFNRLCKGLFCIEASNCILVRNPNDSWDKFSLSFVLAFLGVIMLCCMFAGHMTLGWVGLFLLMFVPLVHSLNLKKAVAKPFKVKVQYREAIPDSEVVDAIMSVLINGRKGMATITNISYLPASKGNIEHDEMVDKKIYVNHGLPNFIVKYKFNPPDDYRKEDITHMFVTHIEPDNHYQIGDPLPILYEIKDNYFYDLVYSMPYPMPIHDMQALTHLIDCSRGGREEDEASKRSDRSNVDNPKTNPKTYPKTNPMTNPGQPPRQDDKDVTDVAEKRRKYQAYLDTYITSYALANATSLKERLKVLSREVSNSYGTNKELIPLLGNYLCERNSKCQSECIKVISEIVFPERTKRSARVPKAIEPVVTYLKMQPRSKDAPAPAAVRAIFDMCKSGWSRNYLLEQLPEAFWHALIEVYEDDHVAPEVKYRIEADYNTYAPPSMRYEFKES